MKRILVINGNVQERTIISSILVKKGYAVVAETDGTSALAVLRDGVHIDVIVTDYDLKDMNAVRFFTSIKKMLPAAPPLVFLCDRMNVSDYLIGLTFGAFELLFRPVKMQELLRIVNLAVQKHAQVHKESSVLQDKKKHIFMERH